MKYYTPVMGIEDGSEVEALHEIDSWQYVRHLVRAALRGESIPPIINNGGVAINGTHRLAANCLMDKLGIACKYWIPVIDLEDFLFAHEYLREELLEMVRSGLVENIDDFLARKL